MPAVKERTFFSSQVESARHDPMPRYRKADPAPPPARIDEDHAVLREFLKLPTKQVISGRQ